MDKFNWKSKWDYCGISLLTLVHAFCRFNAITIKEFVSRFRSDLREIHARGVDLVDEARNSLDLGFLFECDDTIGTGLFPSNYAISGDSHEVARSLKFCKRCLAKGLHFSWQQLAWLSLCPIHNEPLLDRCTCGKKVPYKIRQDGLEIGKLCSCGRLTLAAPKYLSEVERRVCSFFTDSIYSLRKRLPNGIQYLRLTKLEPHKNELVRAHRLTTCVLRSIVEPEGDGIFDVSLSHLCAEQSNDRVADSIQAWFEWFYEYCSRLPQGNPRVEKARQTAARLENVGFAMKSIPAVAQRLHVNGKNVDEDHDIVNFSALLLGYRLIRHLAEIATNGGDVLVPRMSFVTYELGRPLGVITGSQFPLANFNAIWSSAPSYWAPPSDPWVNWLADYLVTTRFFGPTCVERRQNKLVAALRDESRRAWNTLAPPYFAEDNRQLSLFADTNASPSASNL